jgi:hypothetical protein
MQVMMIGAGKIIDKMYFDLKSRMRIFGLSPCSNGRYLNYIMR